MRYEFETKSSLHVSTEKIYLGPLFETVKSEKGICIPICLKLFAYMQNKPN